MLSVWLVFCNCGFHSVCPLRDKDKRLMEAFWWKRLTVGESGSCSNGPTKVLLVKAMVFPVVMYGYESWTMKKAWVLKNWCFWTVVLEKTLESPLDCKEIQPILKEINPKYSLEGLMLKLPILGPPDAKRWLTGKDPDVGEDWGQKRAAEDETAGWDH